MRLAAFTPQYGQSEGKPGHENSAVVVAMMLRASYIVKYFL